MTNKTTQPIQKTQIVKNTEEKDSPWSVVYSKTELEQKIKDRIQEIQDKNEFFKIPMQNRLDLIRAEFILSHPIIVTKNKVNKFKFNGKNYKTYHLALVYQHGLENQLFDTFSDYQRINHYKKQIKSLEFEIELYKGYLKECIKSGLDTIRPL